MQANALKRIVEPLASLMSSHNVKITFGGDNAKTIYNESGVPLEIRLPVISDEAGEEVIRVFHGYLDHEVAHVLYSDLSTIFNELNKDRLLGDVFNIIEDARVERLMGKRFKGSVYNLAYMSERVFSEEYIENMQPHDTLIGKLNRVLFACRIIADLAYFRNIKEQTILEMVNLLVENFGVEMIENLENSEQTLELAKKIIELLDLNQNSEEDKDDQSDGNNQKQSDNSDKAENETNHSSGSEDTNSKPKDDYESKGDENDTVQSEKQSFYSNVEALKQEILRQYVNVARSNETYRVYSTDDDLIEIAKEIPADDYNDVTEATSSFIGTLQKNLERAMASRSIISWCSGQRKGKICGSSLSRLLIKDDRVFKRRLVESNSKDIAVSLVIDCSGSMSGDKTKLAAESAYALSKVLTNIGISHEMLGFTTLCCSNYDCEHYARIEPLYIPIFKTFTEGLTHKVRDRLAYLLSKMPQRNNVDGESIQIAADRLMARPEKRKIMIVLSDGYPAAIGDDAILVGHLEDTVIDLQKKIEVVGIGIKSSAVKQFYKNHVVINDIGELPNTVIKELRRFLVPK